MFYEFLKENYKENEPIFISELQYKNLNMNAIRQQILNLTNKNLLIRYDTGIYFIPGDTIFKNSKTLNKNKIIEKKYISTNDEMSGTNVLIERGIMNYTGVENDNVSLAYDGLTAEVSIF